MNTTDIKNHSDTSFVRQGTVKDDTDLESFLSSPQIPQAFTELIRDLVDERDLNQF
jgi:hypothetical protein